MKKQNTHTQNHEMRPNSDSEHDEIEDINHLKVRIGAIGNEEVANI
jgi:hypothetical protein